MWFTDSEKSAFMCGLIKLGFVDGNLSPEEDSLYKRITNKLMISHSNIVTAARLEANPPEMIRLVQTFSEEKKELFSALLYKMMIADGFKDFAEEGFIEGTQMFYGLPKITPERANKLFNDFMMN